MLSISHKTEIKKRCKISLESGCLTNNLFIYRFKFCLFKKFHSVKTNKKQKQNHNFVKVDLIKGSVSHKLSK